MSGAAGYQFQITTPTGAIVPDGPGSFFSAMGLADNGGITAPGVSQVPLTWVEKCTDDKVRRVNFAPARADQRRHRDTMRRILTRPRYEAQGLLLLSSVILEPDHHEGLPWLQERLRPDQVRRQGMPCPTRPAPVIGPVFGPPF